MRPFQQLAVLGITLAACGSALADAPQYSIIDLGVVGTLGPTEVSQAMGISANGQAFGRSFTIEGGATAFTWSADTGMVALPQLAGKTSAVALGANGQGTVVGVASITVSGLAPQAVVWQNGSVLALPNATGYSSSRAYAVNALGVIVGSQGGGTSERAAIYANGTASLIPLQANGGKMTTAYGISDSGLVVGVGEDPLDASRNVGLIYNMNTGSFLDIGGVTGANGAVINSISNSGYVAGSSSQGQGNPLPFVWTQAGGMQAIPLLANTGYGFSSGVNSSGWVVGADGGLYSNPFLFANGALYSVASLLPANSGWDFVANTASSAVGISDDGTIVGTAYHDGVAHAYEMVLTSAVPEPASYALMFAGLCVVGGIARRRSPSFNRSLNA